MKTRQMDFWAGTFGSEYTVRNIYSTDELDEVYRQQYGLSRTELNRRFLGGLSIERTLEVGSNVGNQLNVLQTMEMEGLYGIELQWFAVQKAKELTENINILQGSAFELPFKDVYFDLVYTSGVLIHISPEDVVRAMDEMYRVSRKYIWGFEYYDPEHQEISYRGHGDKMWKGNFAQMFLDRFPDLKLVKMENFKYTQNDNVDQMYLLEKS